MHSKRLSAVSPSAAGDCVIPVDSTRRAEQVPAVPGYVQEDSNSSAVLAARITDKFHSRRGHSPISTAESGDVLLTEIGGRFTTADIQEGKRIFAEQARHRAPPVRTICKGLAGSRDGSLRAGFFLDLLRPEDARRQLDTAIGWGRYAELYDYDSDSDRIAADPAAQLRSA